MNEQTAENIMPLSTVSGGEDIETNKCEEHTN